MRSFGFFAALSCVLLSAGDLVQAQERSRPRVAIFDWLSAAGMSRWQPLLEGLRRLGYVEGQNLELEYHFAGERSDRAAAIAADLSARRVSVIVAVTTPAAHAAKAATRTIPIVVAPVSDPVATGLVESLARPGGNLTGVTSTSPELAGKRLQLLREIRGDLGSVAFLGSTRDPNARTFLRENEAAAKQLGIQVHPFLIDGPENFESAFKGIASLNVGAVIVQPIFLAHREVIIKLATDLRLPIAADQRAFGQAGALVAYGASVPAYFRRAALQVHRILEGETPSLIPVEQPTEFHLVVNLRTASALGLTVPPTVMVLADELIN
jgi:putative tryptophan/tyrosine transport system substrate-binding protein